MAGCAAAIGTGRILCPRHAAMVPPSLRRDAALMRRAISDKRLTWRGRVAAVQGWLACRDAAIDAAAYLDARL